ncbi:MAG: FAD-dependent 5-carboxymethylaminomethyl-2-thiouridine(34) oxidoreductase MnmC [Ottowia sp.]|nr:FAD-dependent 5-carboxymethylaminomethyl-2-thiouridine(34) oxidoreductase MnmC [Ottowia sp.]
MNRREIPAGASAPLAAHPVTWREDGSPTSLRFNDVYRSAGSDGLGGLAQARQVFLGGCGLLDSSQSAAAWHGAPSWSVLELGFGLGLNFLATWHAWQAASGRPDRLFYSAVEAFPPEPEDLLRSAAPFPQLHPLAQQLAAQWQALLPGVYRLEFEHGRIALTLAVGDVRDALQQLQGRHDSIYLDGFNPAHNPQMWELPVLKAVARLARRGSRAATWCVAASVRKNLTQCGFAVARVAGLPPKRHALQARYDPPWRIRRRVRSDQVVCRQPARCAVIGAGVAGASVAWSLAQRGWQVTVLDRAASPCAGASGVPVGLVAPHVSPDDCALSQLTRAGVRATLSRARALLANGRDFAVTGVLQPHAAGQCRLPPAWQPLRSARATRATTLPAAHETTRARARDAGMRLDASHPALWHEEAGWLRPAALVAALLAAPGITWRPRTLVAAIQPAAGGWQLLDASRRCLLEAELVVVAAGLDTPDLLPDAARLPLNALRGQVSCGPMPASAGAWRWPGFPVMGQGHLVANVPGPDGPWWQTGATFQRGRVDTTCQPEDDAANRMQLAALLPDAAAALEPQWSSAQRRSWAGVRATLPNHLPALGAWTPGQPVTLRSVCEPDALPPPARLPLQLCTGFGARGLTLAVLCGEILAASLHDEPLPVASTLLPQLRASRYGSPRASCS